MRVFFSAFQRAAFDYRLAFAACIFTGSIQLDWHYASDGIIAGTLALLFWKASAILASWSLTRPEMTAEAV